MSEEFNVVILAIFDQQASSALYMSEIDGKPMIQHVYESAKDSSASAVVIATNNPRVGMSAEDFGADVCMIVDEELVGASHLAEVADKMGWGDDVVMLNIPANTPDIPAQVIDQLASNLISQPDYESAILYANLNADEATDWHTIKLVTDVSGTVLYLSRELIPHQRTDDSGDITYKCCLDISAYRAGLLRIYHNLPSGELDKAENIEELKLVYNGIRVHAAEADVSIGKRINSASDIDQVVSEQGVSL